MFDLAFFSTAAFVCMLLCINQGRLGRQANNVNNFTHSLTCVHYTDTSVPQSHSAHAHRIKNSYHCGHSQKLQKHFINKKMYKNDLCASTLTYRH